MPHEKDVIEKHYYWCPKWYWPLAVCTRSGPVHKWCYNFSWVHKTGYGPVIHYEACEAGRLYTWSEAEFGLWFGKLPPDIPFGEMCFDSPRSGGGRCDMSNTGLQASGLSPSAPYVSSLHADVVETGSHVVDSGITIFTEENGGPCRQGEWTWEKIAQEYVATLSVETRFVTIEWQLQGQPLSGNSGVAGLVTEVREPGSPAAQFRTVNIAWTIVSEANRSSLRLRNDPKDCNYSVLVTAVARDGATLVKSQSTYVDFAGLTFSYDPQRLAEELRCILRFKRRLEKPRLNIPQPGELVVVWPEEFLAGPRFLAEIERDVARACLEVMQLAIGQDVALSLAARARFEELIAVPRLAAMVRIQTAQLPKPPTPPAWARRSTWRLLRWMRAYEANPASAEDEDCGCWFR